MKNRLLMPGRFKRIGWLIFITTTIVFAGFARYEWQPAFLSFKYTDTNGSQEVNLLKEIIFTFWMVGLVMIAFSKEKQEDEYISYLRLSCWQYSILASIVISLTGTWAIYGLNYLTFAALNMLTAPLAFIAIFNTTLYLARRRTS